MAHSYTQKLRPCEYCGIATMQNYARVQRDKYATEPGLDLKWQCMACGKYTSNDDPPQDVT